MPAQGTTASVETRHAVHWREAETFDTEALRAHFLVQDLLTPGALNATYTHYDRLMLAGAVPLATPLAFTDAHARLVGSEHHLARRELGLINIGGPGRVTADAATFDLGFQDALYIGAGTASVTFASVDPDNPAKFYINTAPAHARHPARLITKAAAKAIPLGSQESANKRTIYQYLHPDVLPTCQLVMGLTRLDSGSVWNTMPAHTHDRRMEAYLYFELPQDAFTVHLMGRPEATRHLIVRNEQAVVSPPWSIHCGAGTTSYAFIWSMAGDNQAFTDMDMIAMQDLR
jgi:4-deoxy-L-threo-5-hexosulose-uronate ketol-isomerase